MKIFKIIAGGWAGNRSYEFCHETKKVEDFQSDLKKLFFDTVKTLISKNFEESEPITFDGIMDLVELELLNLEYKPVKCDVVMMYNEDTFTTIKVPDHKNPLEDNPLYSLFKNWNDKEIDVDLLELSIEVDIFNSKVNKLY